jgi:hypothetical protein
MTQAVNLANFANSLDSSGGVSPSSLNSQVPISKGGTGATTAAAARTNLGVDYSSLVSLIYPIGSIYTNAAVATSPATLLGFGTWTPFGTGRVLVGVDPSDASFNTLGETGGSKDAIVGSHTHAFATTTTSNGDHQHAVDYPIDCTAYARQFGYTNSSGVTLTDSFCDGGGPQGNIPLTQLTGAHTHTVTGTTNPTGVGTVNANLQPYVTVYMWQRTA